MSFQLAPPIRVAVLGSCVSRDLFNSQFNPHYKEMFECVALSNQVSLISLMSEPVEVCALEMGDLDDYSRREISKEASRAFLNDIVTQRPQYLLVDLFADVHFGCFTVDDRFLTRNRWKIMKTPFYTERERVAFVSDDDRAAYLAVWRESLDRLLAFLSDRLPDTRLVLHRARNVTQSVTADGTLRPLGQEGKLLTMNQWWEQLDDEFASRGVTRVLDCFRNGLTSVDSHPWGPFAVHYTLDYHAAALTRLTRIVLSDACQPPATSAWPASAEHVQPSRRSVRLPRAWDGLRRPRIRNVGI